MIRLPEDDAGTSKHVAVFTKYKMIFLLLHRAFWKLRSSLTNKCTVY